MPWNQVYTHYGHVSGDVCENVVPAGIWDGIAIQSESSMNIEEELMLSNRPAWRWCSHFLRSTRSWD